ncbi:MAG TPA: hypothetical protein VMP01_17690 [Pirellulaceae bacterium]|nr:hypothetical protein [Pirellulaceae bacterium]
MQTARHVLLGCKLTHQPEKVIASLVSEFKGVGNYPQGLDPQFLRQCDVGQALMLAVMRHLSYRTPPDVQKRLIDGFEVALDYFYGEWWKDRTDLAFDFGIMIDKTHPNRDLIWFKTFSAGLLLGLLTERWSDIARLCSWVEPDLKPEYMGGQIEDQLVYIYFSVAASLRTDPMPELAGLEAGIKKCRTKRSRLLFKAWEAARAGDQSAFDKAFRESLEHFDSTYYTASTVVEWIAQHQSVVWLAAKRLGLKFPPLPERLAAMIITRESLGLSATE